MKYFKFQGCELINSIGGIKCLHYKPFLNYAVHEIILTGNSDDIGLLIWSEMQDIKERYEVGSLRFSKNEPILEELISVPLPIEFHSELKLSKLVISEDDFSAESGILIEGSSGAQIYLIAGVYPTTISIKSSFTDLEFKPEYPLEKYYRFPMVLRP